MKDADGWSESKFTWHKGRLVASHDPAEVSPASRLVADLIAGKYQEHLPRFAQGRLLDLGCGKVPLFGAYRALVTEAVCVDWGNSVHGNRHVDVECDLTQPLPFAPASFDTVLLSDVLEHVPEPQKLWDEMARVLKPGGHAFVNVPFLYWLHETPHDFYRYTQFALQRLAQAAGFRVLVLEAAGGAPEVLLDIAGKLLLPVPVAGSKLAALAHVAGRALGRTGWGRRWSQRSAAQFPLGYFMVAQRGA